MDRSGAEAAWQAIVKSFSDWPNERYARWLSVLVAEAATRPELRVLYPFHSLNRLCFSRTPFPWSNDVPCVAAKDGWYSVGERPYEADQPAPNELLFTDDPRAAVQTVVGNLPATPE